MVIWTLWWVYGRNGGRLDFAFLILTKSLRKRYKIWQVGFATPLKPSSGSNGLLILTKHFSLDPILTWSLTRTIGLALLQAPQLRHQKCCFCPIRPPKHSLCKPTLKGVAVGAHDDIACLAQGAFARVVSVAIVALVQAPVHLVIHLEPLIVAGHKTEVRPCLHDWHVRLGHIFS